MGATFDGLKAEPDRFAPALTGSDPFAATGIRADLDRRVRGAHQAKAAVDCALHDLCARALGVPLYQLLGGKVRDSVPILRILPLSFLAPDIVKTILHDRHPIELTAKRLANEFRLPITW